MGTRAMNASIKKKKKEKKIRITLKILFNLVFMQVTYTQRQRNGEASGEVRRGDNIYDQKTEITIFWNRRL